MLVLSLAVALAGQASLLDTATARLSTACREASCAEPVASPYRITPDREGGLSAKASAVAEDGRRCQVIGTRMCTRAPRSLFRADLSR
jgi:hypothetical protein